MLTIRSTAVAFLATASFLTATASTGNDGWVTVRPADRSFSVQMPGFPESNTSVFKDKVGGVSSDYLYRYGNDTGVYFVREVRFQPGVLASDVPVADFTKNQNSLAIAMKANVNGSKDTVFLGHKARLVSMAGNLGRFKAILFNVGNRSMAVYAQFRDSDKQPDVQRFFNSFQVTVR